MLLTSWDGRCSISLANPEDPVAAVSIAHAEGVAIAIAATDPSTHLGIAVETIAEPQAGTLAIAFTPGEERLLARVSAAVKAEWVARFRCAAAAALKAIGTDGPAPNLRCEITQFDEPSGAIEVAFDPQSLEAPRAVVALSFRSGEATMSGPGPCLPEKELIRDFRPIPNRNPG